MESNFKKLTQLMARLRAPDGCPWDIEQDYSTLQNCLIEEIYELIESINENDCRKIKEELADVLFLVIFLSRIGEEKGHFNIDDVIKQGIDKMISRHPHVFGKVRVKNSDEALRQWENIKRKEPANHKRTSALDGVPKNLPALQKAEKIQKKAAKTGFDWSKAEEVIDKLEEELDELKTEIFCRKKNFERISDELGDLIFTMVNLSRFLKVDPEYSLHKSIKKFDRRFRKMEEMIKKGGKNILKLTPKKLDLYWEKSKRQKTD
ncbi:MAG: nucleoside triphosphate pyrophosphohydrolase [bacterium]|nr:nucleoside triphosphate pyrophosphohydrolase [bacterium]